MVIDSVKRNPEYASWTVEYSHNGVKRAAIVRLNAKNSLLECVGRSEIDPPFALEIIRDELADRSEVIKSFDDTICEIRPEEWAK